jgi:acetyltransferase EpsM
LTLPVVVVTPESEGISVGDMETPRPERTVDAECRVVLIGAGGHGAEVAAYLSDLARDGWAGSFAGFLDDHASDVSHRSGRVLGRIDDFALSDAARLGVSRYMVAVGDSRVRKQLVERIERLFGPNLAAWTLIHPRAYVGPDVMIGEGTLLAPAVLATTRISLGRHVIVNIRASVSHDAVIADFVTLNPAATICGNVTIGEGASIGAGAVVKEQVTIGCWSKIGAGAVVVHDIPPYSVAVGVPARVIKSIEP